MSLFSVRLFIPFAYFHVSLVRPTHCMLFMICYVFSLHSLMLFYSSSWPFACFGDCIISLMCTCSSSIFCCCITGYSGIYIVITLIIICVTSSSKLIA